MDRAVGQRVPARLDQPAFGERLHMHQRQPAAGPIGRAHPRDGDRQVEIARAEPGDGLLAIFGDRIGIGVVGDHIAQGVILAEPVPGIGGRLVDREGRHHQRRLGAAAMVEHEAAGLGVDRYRPVIAAPVEAGGDVEHIGEIAGQIAEIALYQIDLAGGDTQRLHLCLLRGIAEARNPPHLVVLRQLGRDREGDPPGRAGDQDFLAGKHDHSPACAPERWTRSG